MKPGLQRIDISHHFSHGIVDGDDRLLMAGYVSGLGKPNICWVHFKVVSLCYEEGGNSSAFGKE